MPKKKKTKAQQIQDLWKQGIKETKEVRKQTGAHRTYIYETQKKLEKGFDFYKTKRGRSYKQSGQPVEEEKVKTSPYKPLEPTEKQPDQEIPITTDQEPGYDVPTGTYEAPDVTVFHPKITPPPELEEIAKQIVEPAVDEAKEKGMFTEESCTAIFQSINDALCQFDTDFKVAPESNQLMGNLAVTPFNRILGASEDENIDLYMLIVCAIIIYSPAFAKVARKQLKKRKEKSRLPKSKEKKIAETIGGGHKKDETKPQGKTDEESPRKPSK